MIFLGKVCSFSDKITEAQKPLVTFPCLHSLSLLLKHLLLQDSQQIWGIWEVLKIQRLNESILLGNIILKLEMLAHLSRDIKDGMAEA